jgi:hypothetical protein
VGRPVTKAGSAAAKKRSAEKKRYNALPISKRKKLVQTRDKEAQRKADAKRLRTQKPERTEYHREQARSRPKSGAKPTVCQWPGCKVKKNLQWHHQGSRDRYLCPTHHAEARRRAK